MAKNNYQKKSNNNNQNLEKRSGATYSKIKQGNFQGETIVNAWRVTSQGLVTAVCTPYNGKGGRGADVVTNKKGTAQYQKMICVLTQGIQKATYHVLMNMETHVIVIQELSLCITPNGSGVTANGKKVTGYFGRNYSK